MFVPLEREFKRNLVHRWFITMINTYDCFYLDIMYLRDHFQFVGGGAADNS